MSSVFFFSFSAVVVMVVGIHIISIELKNFTNCFVTIKLLRQFSRNHSSVNVCMKFVTRKQLQEQNVCNKVLPIEKVQ